MKFNYHKAHFTRRLFAFVIDLLIVDFVLLYPFNKIFSDVFSEKTTTRVISEMLESNSYLLLSIILIFFLYFVLFEYKIGQTIGKMLVNIYSVSLKGEMNLIQAIGRNIFLIPVVPFIFLWVIDPIFILWKGRSLSEILTNTITIEKRYVPWQTMIKQK
ncbi:MAG: RDD family protein [Candidatus Woesearchaeota archaeon]